MRIQPYMIAVTYDHDVESLLPGKTLEVIDVQKIEPIRYDIERKCWYTQNHYRKQIKNNDGQLIDQMLQIGITIEANDLENINVYFSSIHEDDVEKIPLYYCEDEKVWFELSRFENKKKGSYFPFDNKKVITGIAHAGSLDLVVEQNNEEVKRERITFYPSAISVADYNVMISDLFRIREDLLRNEKSLVSVGALKQKTAEQLKKIIENLEGPIKAISKTPASMLSFRREKDKIGGGEKFRIRTEIEKELFPGKNKYQVFKGYENVALEENKLIKHQLIKLKRYSQFYEQSSQLMKMDDKRLTNEFNVLFEKTSKDTQNAYKRIYAQYNDKEKTLAVLLNELEKGKKIAEQNIEVNKLAIKNKLQRLSLFHNDFLPPANSVPVYITCELNSELYKKYVDRKYGLKVIINSSWIEEEGIVPLKFINYETEQWPLIIPKSQFITITNNSKDIRSHWILLNALQEAEEQLQYRDSIKIRIHGFAIPNGNARDDDLFGQLTYNPKYRNYNFEMASITDVYINEERFEYSIHEPFMFEELTELLPSLDQENTMNDAQIENIDFEIKKVEKMKQIIETQMNQRTQSVYFEDLVKQIDEWLDLPLFCSLSITGSEKLRPTQLFLHDPYYRSIWKSLNDIEEIIGLSLVTELGTKHIGIEKVHEVYENWVLFKMIYLLTTEMGWKIDGTENVVDYLDKFILPGQKDPLKNFHIDLYKDKWVINLANEPKIFVNHEKYFTPDYVFRIYMKENDDHLKNIGIMYLDAKHRNYLEQGDSEWKKDIKTVAIDKYGKLKPVEKEWNMEIIGSFLVHSDIQFGMEKELTGENYFAYYNTKQFPENEYGFSEENAHKYGAIYLLPSATFPFINWFRSMMEFRLGEYDQCWTCGSTEVKSITKYTEKGFRKFHYTCNNCGEFWVKSHCNKGHDIIKHVNNYHKQKELNKPWFIVCPTCHDGEINKQRNDHRFDKTKVKSHIIEIDDDALPF